MRSSMLIAWLRYLRRRSVDHFRYAIKFGEAPLTPRQQLLPAPRDRTRPELHRLRCQATALQFVPSTGWNRRECATLGLAAEAVGALDLGSLGLHDRLSWMVGRSNFRAGFA